jgi:biopolymer transport protein ExbD
MAFVQVGSRGRSRSVDHELPLVPFIDFLLCLIAFLLVTAVWSQMARLPADARVPGLSGPAPKAGDPELHVRLTDRAFELSWRRGAVVIEQQTIPRAPVILADGTRRYPTLEAAVAASWRQHGVHRSAHDAVQDRAVLHTSNSAEFGDVVAVLDAIRAPRRPAALAPELAEVAALSVSFAAD